MPKLVYSGLAYDIQNVLVNLRDLGRTLHYGSDDCRRYSGMRASVGLGCCCACVQLTGALVILVICFIGHLYYSLSFN